MNSLLVRWRKKSVIIDLIIIILCCGAQEDENQRQTKLSHSKISQIITVKVVNKNKINSI